MSKTEVAFLGLGANVGTPRETLSRAVVALGSMPGTTMEAVSPLYRTRPVGPVSQPDFLNAAARLRVPAGSSPEVGAMALLVALKQLEHAMGRTPSERWGPREVDLDLLLFGPHRVRVERGEAARSDDPERDGVQWLEVPHPAAARRAFVLVPLADLAPQLEPPGWGMSVEDACARALVAEGANAVQAVAEWDHLSRAWLP